MVSLLFSFHGRINRKQYWQAGSLVGVLGLMGLITLLTLSGLSITDVEDPAQALGAVSTFAIFALPLMAFVSWTGYAIQVKRLHDRGRTGYLALLPILVSMGLISTLIGAIASNAPAGVFVAQVQPYSIALNIINLWFFIDLGCLPGVDGPNKYGDPPGTPRKFNLDGGPAKPLSAPKSSAEAASSLFGAQSAMDRAIAEKEKAPQMQRRPAAMPSRNAEPAPAAARAAPASFGRRVPR